MKRWRVGYAPACIEAPAVEVARDCLTAGMRGLTFLPTR